MAIQRCPVSRNEAIRLRSECAKCNWQRVATDISGQSLRRLMLTALAIGLPFVSSAILAEEPRPPRFTAADADGDKKLSLEEFQTLPGEPNVLQRDFRLFDWNRDKSLSVEEFDAMLWDGDRGNVPNPLDDVLQRAVEQMDENFDHWDQDPNREVSTVSFVQSFLLSFPEQQQAPLFNAMKQLTQDADENRNGRVDRDEARRFLEIQLGLRHGEGALLHLPHGRVIRYGTFLSWDANQDQRVSLAEFTSQWPDKETLDQQWNQLDRDRNEQVEFGEFVQCKELAWDDPIERFRGWDTNLDALLDEKELFVGVAVAERKLLPYMFSAFDVDADGQLTLWEFRQTPLANAVLIGSAEPMDGDRNGVLQFSEFAATDGRFPLLRLIYYLRFDTDGSGELEAKEYPFAERPGQALYRLNADGTGWRQLFASKEFPVIGSPKISPDGKWLACDAIARGGDFGGTRLLLMTIEGEDAKDFGEGSMPSWSADSKQLTYSYRGAIHLLDLETKTTRQLVERGWGAQWSPDGKKIAFTVSGSLKTLTVETGQIAEVLSPTETPYRKIYWNMAWSPDSQRMVFRGVRPNGTAELASVHMEGEPKLKVHYAGPRDFSNNLAWSPDGRRIVFGMQGENSTRTLLYELNPDGDGEPVLFKGPDPALQIDDPCWHPDGTYLILHGRHGDQWTE